MDLQRPKDLGPYGDHAEKQGDRGQCSGFFNDGTKHDVLPERTENIVHLLFFCQAPVVGQFELWRETRACLGLRLWGAGLFRPLLAGFDSVSGMF